MTISTAHFKRSLRRTNVGFTLVEIMIAMALATVLLAGATAVMLAMAKGSESLINYSEMNTQSRRALSNLGTNLRSGMDIIDASETHLTFTRLPEAGPPEELTFRYDSGNQQLILELEDGSSEIVLRDVTSLNFHYYTHLQDSTTHPLEIKHVQLEAELTRRVVSLTNRNYVISARFMLRNKRVNDS